MKSKKKNKKLSGITGCVVAGVSVAAVAFLADCGSNKSTTPSYSYAGAGTNWSVNLDSNGTFTATESVNSVSAKGTYVRNSAGFVQFTIPAGGITGSNLPSGASNGLSFYGLEVPGVALLIPPVLADETQLITSVAAGTCPTANFDGNYIYTQFAGSDSMTSTTRDFFGQFSYTMNGSTATTQSQLSTMWDLSYGNNVGTAQDTPGLTCASGIVNSSNFDGYAMPGAAFIKETGSGDGMLVMPQYTIPSLSAISGGYHGIYTSGATGVSPTYTPVSVSISGSSGTATPLNSSTFESATGSADTLSLGSINQPGTGFVEVTLTDASNATGNGICMFNGNVMGSGKNILFCLSQDPANNANPINSMLVSD